MKKVLLTIACLVSAMAVSAQRASSSSSSFFSTEKADQPVTFGVRAGMNVSTLTGDVEDVNSRIGFNVGVSLDIPLLQSLYLQTGLYATQKGFKYDETDDGVTYEEKANPLYLQIPILASYRYNFSDATQLQVNFGPYLAYGIAGKYKESGSYSNASVEHEYDYFGDDDDQFGAKRFDCGLMVGAGVTVSKFYIGCAYEFGLTNIFDSEDDDYSVKNGNFMVNVGYNF